MRRVFKYCPVRKEVVPIEQVFRENLSAYVWDDTVEEFESHATGERKKFNSMSAYKRHLAEHGFEITGGDHLTGRTVENTPWKPDKEQLLATIAEEVRKNEWGMNPLTEKEKHRCQQEREALVKEAKDRGIPIPRWMRGEW